MTQAKHLVSRQTCSAFREILSSHFVLRDIEQFFGDAGLIPDTDHNPSNIDGQRRTLVEQYYAGIDFTDAHQTNQLLSAFETILHELDAQAEPLVTNKLEQQLGRDGYGYENGRIAAGSLSTLTLEEYVRDFADVNNLPTMRQIVDRMMNSIDSDPAVAIGSAKELLESTCKTILEDRGVSHQSLNIPKLHKAVCKELQLLPESIHDDVAGADTLRRILQSHAQIVIGLAELRNLYGSGHGRSGSSAGVQPHHARFAVGTALSTVSFLLHVHRSRGP